MKRKNFYTYAKMKKEFDEIKSLFSAEAEYKSIGKSVWGREIECIKIGKGETKILFCGAHHGMEHLTSKLLLTFAREYLWAIKSNGKIGDKNARKLKKHSSLYIVPMLNPDGVDLSVYGLSAPDIINKDYLMKINPGGDFSDWQANARGVDLNHNYDALFNKSKESEKTHGIKGAGRTRYSGEFPESEPETKSLCDFTRAENFNLVMAFHSQGKVIYYDFNGKEPVYSHAIAKTFEDISEYKIDYTEGIASFGGYKDWFIDKFLRPGFTIEIGEGKNPLPLSDLHKVYHETLPIMTNVLGLNLP